tara:strand:+ start:262 stop:663 length:402 start_codon:yes stop_codon:yes gene_type:complete
MEGTMLGKLNDNIAALVLGIYLLGIIMYVVQLIFMTEIWLKGEEVDVSAVTVARVLGGAWLGLGLGIVLTFLNGPDGQKTFFMTILVAQFATLLVLLHGHFVSNLPKLGDDVAIVSVLTILLLVGWFRIKDRL